MKDITAAIFEQVTGYPPENDDLERCNCDKVGEAGHMQCGWDFTRNMPNFMLMPGAREANPPGSVKAVFDALAQIVYTQNGNRHADITGLLEDARVAREHLTELVACYDLMLARWWSNATDADKALANRAAAARMRFNGEEFPKDPPLDLTLGERRREAADRARTRGERE